MYRSNKGKILTFPPWSRFPRLAVTNTTTTTVSKDADDLVSEIHSQNVECFNSTTSWKFAVTEGRDSPLLSLDLELDDGELLLTIQFNQIVHLRAVLVHGKSGEERISAPKRVKLFANKPNYQFDDCSTKKATQKLLFEENECIFREEMRWSWTR